MAQIVAGRDYREVHLSAHRILGDLLQQIGLTKLPGQAALERGITSVFFPHGIGHLLGLQVHDVGGVMDSAEGGERKRPEGHPYLRLTRMLEPGVVVTVEPGIYLIDSLLQAANADARRPHIDWPLVEALRPYGGIRIEDNVATTAAGPENITRDRVRHACGIKGCALRSGAARPRRRLPWPYGAWVPPSPRPQLQSCWTFCWILQAPCRPSRHRPSQPSPAAESTSCMSAMSAESPGRGSILRMRV